MSFMRRFLLLIALVVGLEQVVCSNFGRSILQDAAAAPVADTTEDVAEAETVDAGSITAYQTVRTPFHSKSVPFWKLEEF